MQKVHDFSKWLAFSDKEKEEEYASWDVYAGEGENILQGALTEFMSQYGSDKDIVNATTGLCHGGLWTIELVIKKGVRKSFPKQFLGFPVIISRSKLRE